MLIWTRIAAVGLVAALAGCGDDSAGTGGGDAAGTGGKATSTSTGQTGALCDAQNASTCRVDQQACNLDAAGAASCFECERGEHVAIDGTCVTIPGQSLQHAFSEFTTQPGEEIKGLCQSWTIGNETDLYVNAVELWQDEASHHSNWTFVPDDEYGEDGVWPCDERGYDQLAAAVSGGVLYAQSTQATREVQKFPDGAVVRIPAHSRIIGDVHLLNVGTGPVTGHVELSLFSLDESEVKVKLAPFHMTYDGLDIPPRSRSRFEGSCATSDLEGSDGGPVSMKVYYVLPHTHAQGRRFFFGPKGGDSAPGLLFDVAGFNGEARGQGYDPPIQVGGSEELYFGCEFDNPRDESIQWGFGDQEMCEMLGFIEADFAFESRISTAQSAGEEDGMPVFTGPCQTIRLPWDSKL